MQVQEMVFCDKIKCIFVTVHFIFLRLNENVIYAIFVVILPAIIKVVGTSVDIYVDWLKVYYNYNTFTSLEVSNIYNF